MEINKVDDLIQYSSSPDALTKYAIDSSRILSTVFNWPGPLRQSVSYTATEDCYFILFDARSNSGNGVSFILSIDGVELWNQQFDNYSVNRPFSCFLKAGQNITISCGYHLHYIVFGLK